LTVIVEIKILKLNCNPWGLGVSGSKTIIITNGMKRSAVELPFRPACRRHGAGGVGKQDNNNHW